MHVRDHDPCKFCVEHTGALVTLALLPWCFNKNGPATYWCDREFSGMIQSIIMNDDPGNPHSHPFPETRQLVSPAARKTPNLGPYHALLAGGRAENMPLLRGADVQKTLGTPNRTENSTGRSPKLYSFILGSMMSTWASGYVGDIS